MKHKIKIMAGNNITDAISESIALAQAKSCEIEFEFNGVSITVAGDSDPALIYREWDRGMLRPHGFVVKPYPTELTTEDVAADAHYRAERDQRLAKMKAESERKNAEKSKSLAPKIESVALDIKDAAKWRSFITNNSDTYGSACVRFADAWGRLMQARMAGGESLADVAEACSHEANTEGITGFMYGAAVSVLAECWEHGEELRRWHNLDTQIGNEGERANESGGVLNPAMLRIGA